MLSGGNIISNTSSIWNPAGSATPRNSKSFGNKFCLDFNLINKPILFSCPNITKFNSVLFIITHLLFICNKCYVYSTNRHLIQGSDRNWSDVEIPLQSCVYFAESRLFLIRARRDVNCIESVGMPCVMCLITYQINGCF